MRIAPAAAFLLLACAAVGARAGQTLAEFDGEADKREEFVAEFNINVERKVHMACTVKPSDAKGEVTVKLQRHLPDGIWTTIQTLRLTADGTTPGKQLPTGDYRILVVANKASFSLRAVAD